MSAAPASLSGAEPEPGPELAAVVAELRAHNARWETPRPHLRGRHALPSREKLGQITRALRAALFPVHFGAADTSAEGLAYFVGRTLDGALWELRAEVERALHYDCAEASEVCRACEARARQVTRAFLAELPRISGLLGTDVQAAFDGDPAARSVDEAIVCYPGITAITHHRLAHALHALDVPLIPRIVAEIAHADTGIDIHPAASIDESFFIDHGTGVVIGETCRIGRRVRLYQGVTLGAKRFPLDEQGHPLKGLPRHPILEDDVVVYAGATILGRVTIGRGARIGGNVWITKDVPAESAVTQAQAQNDVFEGGLGI